MLVWSTNFDTPVGDLGFDADPALSDSVLGGRPGPSSRRGGGGGGGGGKSRRPIGGSSRRPATAPPAVVRPSEAQSSRSQVPITPSDQLYTEGHAAEEYNIVNYAPALVYEGRRPHLPPQDGGSFEYGEEPETEPLEERTLPERLAATLETLLGQLDVVTQTVALLEQRLSMNERMAVENQRLVHDSMRLQHALLQRMADAQGISLDGVGGGSGSGGPAGVEAAGYGGDEYDDGYNDGYNASGYSDAQ